MANRYWVGGTGTWNTTSTTNWSASSGGASGASVPTAADSVFFDQAGTYTVTMTGALTCLDFTVSAGTVTFATGTTPTLAISGSMSLVAATVWNSTGQITFNATTTGKTITTNGVTITGAVTLNNAAGGWTLGSALTTSGAFTVTAGTFSTANFNLTAAALLSNNSNVRSISLGSSTVTTSSATGVDFGASVNLTFNAGTSTINNTVASVSAVLGGGGQTFYNVSFTGVPTGSLTVTITGANTFNNLSITAPNNNLLRTFSVGANQTINGTFSAVSTTATARLFIKSSTAAGVRTLTCAAVSLTDCDFQDITLAGAAAGSSITRAGDCGNNTGITFPAAKTVYWNLTGTKGYSDTAWATSIGGTPAVNNFPLAQDTAVFVNTGAPGTVNFSSWNMGTVDASAMTSGCTFSFGTGSICYGDWKNGSALVLSGSGSLTFAKRGGTQNVTSNGRSFNFTQFIVNALGGSTVVLQDNFSCGFAVVLTNGTLNLNGKTATVTGTFSTASGTKNITFNGGTLSCASGFTNSAFSGFTTTAGTGTGKISMTSATAKTFAAGNAVYNCTLSQDGLGTLTITGSSTFTTIANSVQPTTILFTAGTTTTITNWAVNGTAGNLVTIGSVTAATHTLSKASGTVSADYLSISNSIATGGAAWYAGANSTNGGGNTGWIFTAPPSASNSKFLMFF